MEMAFIITGSFDQHYGEFDIGPVEIELFLTILFGLAGIFGYQVVDESVNQFLPDDLLFLIPDYIKMQHILAFVFFFLISLLVIENIIKSYKINP